MGADPCPKQAEIYILMRMVYYLVESLYICEWVLRSLYYRLLICMHVDVFDEAGLWDDPKSG